MKLLLKWCLVIAGAWLLVSVLGLYGTLVLLVIAVGWVIVFLIRLAKGE